MKPKTKQIRIESLIESDTFVMDGIVYTVMDNARLSKSFNELYVICEGEQQTLRIKKDTQIWLNNTPTTQPDSSQKQGIIEKTRNDKGNLVSVKFIPITERSLSDSEIKERDKCADELLDNDRFVDKYGDDKDNMHNTAYGTCTNRVKGIKNKSNKEKTNESVERLNTIRKAIRRTFE